MRMYYNVVNKNVNSLIKKFHILYEYKEDLLQQGFLYVDEAIKNYDPTKNRSVDFWVNLKVSSGLRNYVYRDLLPYVLSKRPLDENSRTISYNKVYLAKEIYEKLDIMDKFVLYMVLMNDYSPLYIAKKYNIPVKYIEKIVSNLTSYFKDGDFNDLLSRPT